MVVPSKPKVSMFFPAYNEEENIAKLIDSAKRVLKEVAEEYEIIVVLYDGSTDKTRDIVKAYAQKDKRIKLVLQPKDQKGMGIALRMGLEACKHEIMFYADADNQFDLQEFKTFLPYLNEADMIIGYRMKRQDPLPRIITSKIYNYLIRFLFHPKARDVDCAFRMIKKSLYQKLDLQSRTGMFTSEMIIKARKLRAKIKEIGVHHYPRTAGQPVFVSGSNLPKWKVVKDLLREMMELRRGIR